LRKPPQRLDPGRARALAYGQRARGPTPMCFVPATSSLQRARARGTAPPGTRPAPARATLRPSPSSRSPSSLAGNAEQRQKNVSYLVGARIRAAPARRLLRVAVHRAAILGWSHFPFAWLSSLWLSSLSVRSICSTVPAHGTPGLPAATPDPSPSSGDRIWADPRRFLDICQVLSHLMFPSRPARRPTGA
jgi:hypothetical protein